MTEGAFEARKWGWRQTKEGTVVSFLVHPNDVNADLATAPLGTIYAIGFREMPEGDVSNSVRQTEAGPQSATDAAPTPEAERKGADKPRRPFTSLSRAQQAGLLCNDARFQDWFSKDDELVDHPDAAAAAVREYCGVQSRSDLDTNQKAARIWDALVLDFRRDTNQMAEMRG